MTALPKIGEIVDGKYRIDCELGRGGMAVVFGATQLLTRRDVALKWLLPPIARNQTIVERFLREAQAASRIQHPSVVSVLDVGRWMDDGYFLVMERLVGETLRTRLDRERTLPVSDAMSIAGALLGALHAAHAAGVVHRDLKPENVFLRLDDRGRLRGTKLLDFGISRLSEKESLTLTGQYVGTAYYLAPEQAGGATANAPQIDVYQLGVLLYEALSGRRPYEAPSYGEIIIALLTTTPPPLGALRPDLPFGLVQAVERAMARDPAIRSRSALAMARELAPFGARFDEDLERALSEESEGMATSTAGPVTPPAPVVSTMAYAPTAYGSVPITAGSATTDPMALTAAAPSVLATRSGTPEGPIVLPTSRVGPIALAV
ncbi:MAG: serine/threonine-protein kinase, partial [Sandaracinus sp.]